MSPRPRYPGQSHQSTVTNGANEAHQHDLSLQAAALVVAQAPLHPGSQVLEIGPGLGALTAEILKAGATVVAIERDPKRVLHLQQRFAAELTKQQLTLVSGDATRLSANAIHSLITKHPDWQVISNPPFSLTAHLVRHWLLSAQPPTAMTLVLQKEAAEKLTGVDLGHTRTSILTHLLGKPRINKHLPRHAVTPPSRVDLAIWSHVRHAQTPAQQQLQAIDRLLAIAFAGPRTIREALRSVATTVQMRRQAAEHGWHLQDHPRTLSPAAWDDLAQLLQICGKLSGP